MNKMHFFFLSNFFRCFAIIPYIKVVFEEVKFIQKSATKTNKHYLQSVALAWSKVTSYEFLTFTYISFVHYFRLLVFGILVTIDLSIASTKTKYINLNAKTQNIFCHLNENLTTFLYTLTGATRKQSVYKSWMLLKRKFGF